MVGKLGSYLDDTHVCATYASWLQTAINLCLAKMLAQDRQLLRLLRQGERVRCVPTEDIKTSNSCSEKSSNPVDAPSTDNIDLEHGIQSTRKTLFPAISLRRLIIIVAAVVLATLYVSPHFANLVERYRDNQITQQLTETCPQAPRATPSEHAVLLKNLESLYNTDNFKQRAYDGLSGAVQIPHKSSYSIMLPILITSPEQRCLMI